MLPTLQWTDQKYSYFVCPFAERKKKINPDVFYLNYVMVLLGLLLQLVLGRLVLRLTQQKHQPAQNNRRQILCRRGPLELGGGLDLDSPASAECDPYTYSRVGQ